MFARYQEFINELTPQESIPIKEDNYCVHSQPKGRLHENALIKKMKSENKKQRNKKVQGDKDAEN